MIKPYIFCIFLLPLLILSACGGEDEVLPSKAKDVLQESVGISEETTVPLPDGNFLQAPNFRLLDVNDVNEQRLVSLNDEQFKGKVVMVNFWAAWCKPCSVEIPEFVKLYNKYKPKGFELIAISVDDEDTKDQVKPQMKALGMNYTSLWGNAEVVKSYKLMALPTSYLLDRAHRIRFSHVGLQPIEVFEAEVVKLVSERL